MTETEWLTSDQPMQMLQGPAEPFLTQAAEARRRTQRKRDLFSAACCRLVWRYIVVDSCQRVVEWMEESPHTPAADELDELSAAVNDAARHGEYEDIHEGVAADLVLDACGGDCTAAIAYVTRAFEDVLPADTSSHVAALMRDIVGNPFRPVAVDPDWLTSTVVALARGIYDDRAFDRMPLLADALHDAGCEHAAVLDHCRGPGPHARGCWVVDLLLGKA